MKRSVFLAVAALAYCFSTACDPADGIQKYFSDQLLHQVGSPTENSIRLGQVFVYYKGKPSDALGNMFDNYGQTGWLDSADVTEDDNTVMPSLAKNTVFEPSVGIDVFKGLFKVNVLGDVKIDSTFTISSILASKRVMPGPVVDRYLDSRDSEDFRRYVANRVHKYKKNACVTVAYKVLRTNKMSITAQGGRDISSSLKFDGPAVAVGAGFKVRKTRQSTLEIDGDISYVFAVGVLQLVPEKNHPQLYRVSYKELGLRSRDDAGATSVTGGDTFDPLDDFVSLSELELE